MNRLKTTFLLSLLTVLMVFMGSAMGGRSGMVMAFVMALGMNFFSYWFSDKIVLRMYGAREVTAAEAPEFYNLVARLAQRAAGTRPDTGTRGIVSCQWTSPGSKNT